jgi:hypothetical protein
MFSWFLYLLIPLLVGCFAYTAQYGNEYYFRLSSRFVCFFIMFIPAALRYGIMSDYFSYITYYYDYNTKINGGEIFHFIFSLLRYIAHLFNLPGHGFIVFVAVLIYLILCFSIPRKHVFTILLFYILSSLYLWSYGALRNILAVSLLFCATFCYYNGRKLFGLFIVFCSCLIHTSSVIMFPVLIMSEIKISNIKRIIILAILLFIIFFVDIFYYLGILFNQYENFQVFTTYFNFAQSGTGLMIIFYMLPSILILSNSKKFEIHIYGNFILNLNSLYIIVALGGWRVGFDRFPLIYLFIPLISLEILYKTCKKYGKLFKHSFFFAYIVFYLRYLYVYIDDKYIAYQSILSR